MHCEKRCHGPGYQTPIDAFKNGAREKLIYVSCTHPVDLKAKLKDYLAVIDVDPKSVNYLKIIDRCYSENFDDEFHHFNWNTCSSCFNESDKCRDKLILPCLTSDRIYVFDVSKDEKQLKIVKVIDNLRSEWKLSAPHTVHCLASGDVMISTMGDENDEAKGSFILLDTKTWTIKSKWCNKQLPFGYDFWYQPRHNVMVSSEWGAPKAWKSGLNLDDVKNGLYGHHIHFWNWNTKEIIKSIDLGDDGLLPLEIRYLHEPSKTDGFVGCALSSNVFWFGKNNENEWIVKKVISVKSMNVKNWFLPSLPGVITDILISIDDHYLYFSNWLQGDVRQYDIINPSEPKLVGQLYIGGILMNNDEVEVETGFTKPTKQMIKGKQIRGGPQMLQLSLDGTRLYVTTSLFSVWDKQFYPQLSEKGGMLLKIDVDIINGGLKLDENFLVDFGDEPDGPALAHEIRYPGGDCSSDIWL